MNRYPLWKYLVLAFTLFLGALYAVPNLYGEDPAVQLSVHGEGKIVEVAVVETLHTQLAKANIRLKAEQYEANDKTLLLRFYDTEAQLKAKDVIKQSLGDEYTVAVNLAPMTPKWLAALGAKPMKLGLDLRGGVHFLMEVDTATGIARRSESFLNEVRTLLRNEKLRYTQVQTILDKATDKSGFSLSFSDKEDRDNAFALIKPLSSELEISRDDKNNQNNITVMLSAATVQEIRNYTVDQTTTTLRNRVNELGVAEAVVQRQGLNHVVVELPGIQDTARAKDILGKTATLEFLLRDTEGDVNAALQGKVPPGSKLYYDRHKRPVLMKKRIILSGDAITGAVAGSDSRDGRPSVNVRVGGSGLDFWKKATRENRGKDMGVVYIETRVSHELVDGKWESKQRTEEILISVATINEALGSRFQITGLSPEEAQNLALMLRAGALPATISIVEERTVGPSLGQQNIQKGVLSIEVGMGLVILMMAVYYSVFGLIANLGLVINLILLVSIMSIVGATLTLPGIAGMVLTVGMAVDANVLIFERIREEMRLGLSPHASIHSGFERALSTIIDSNLTTLIVGIILFSVGTGPIRGFAVVLCIGILTSMLTAVTYTRAIVNLAYGGRQVKRLQVGI